MEIFLIICLTIVSIVMIVSILLQPSQTGGFGNIISGSTDTFYNKNKPKTKETVLAKVTVVSALLFAVIVIGLNLI
ncbi:MAG: preprotein translocase subunit SecG [Clostridiaceae bacterium]